MDDGLIEVLRECTEGSDAGRMNFPDVVGRLKDAGVEHYHADLLRAEKTYYLPDGRSHRLACSPLAAAPVETFSQAAVSAAIRAIQGGRSTYKDFCRDIAAAGCVGYLVSLPGARAVYYGRSGETFVEPFPRAA